MKQRIVIVVLTGAAAELLLQSRGSYTDGEALHHSLVARLGGEDVIYYSEHLDLWSMGDSLDRFLRPRSACLSEEIGADWLYAIPRRRLRLSAKPRNEEERLLLTFLQAAKSMYPNSDPDACLLVLRRVLGASDGLPFSSHQLPGK